MSAARAAACEAEPVRERLGQRRPVARTGEHVELVQRVEPEQVRVVPVPRGQRYIRADRVVIAAVTRNGEELKRQLASDDVSPMNYNSDKPKEITEEDKVVEAWPLKLRAEDIKVRPVTEVFQ